MKLSKHLISGIAATTIIGAAGLAYAQTVTPPETTTTPSQTQMQTQTQPQMQPQTQPQTQMQTSPTTPGSTNPSSTTSTPGMNTDAMQTNSDGQLAPRADRN